MKKQRVIDTVKLDKFMAVYKPALAICHEAYRNEYAWPIEELETICDKMRAAIISGSYNYDSRAMKVTCKTLHIKFNRRNIELYIALKPCKNGYHGCGTYGICDNCGGLPIEVPENNEVE